ncbi:hypothetical protein Taro_034409 [Colocasia esculenta]|uniref:RING-type domain-containing protein n=1 Tax=Colocasia esculenta TaxID=4460 RepID=A0A843VWC6_COLES|nr:hypothetical protein [Colocasia esculenta]
MDEYSNKKGVGGLGFNRRGTVAFRDNHESRGTQYCNRIGCSTRHGSLTGTQTGKPEKKLPRPAFLSTSSRTTVGSSSRISSNLNNHGKSQRVRRNTLPLQEKDCVEGSSRQVQKDHPESNTTQEEMVALDIDPTVEHVQRVPPETDDDQSSILQEFTINMAEESRKCQLSSSRNQKPNGRKTESGNEATASSSPVRHSVVPRNTNHIVRPFRNQVGNAQKHGLRNLSCASISDVLPSGCSSSDTQQNKRTDTLRKRYIDGESTAAKGKRIVGSSSRGNPDSSKTGPSGLSLLERPSAQPASRTRNQLASRDHAFSVRTRRSTNGDNRMRFSEQSNDNTFLLPEPLIISPISQAQISLNEAPSSSISRPFPTYIPSRCQSYSGQAGSSSGTSRSRPTVHSEDSDATVSHDPWVDRDGYRRLNMEGIEEEEYLVGDEVGKLHCDHRYHMTCIHQWLRQKNWCPICKSAACPSKPSGNR